MYRSLPLTLGLTLVCFGQTNANDPLLPPNARPGSCYARVFVEPTYQTETQRVLLRGGYDKLAVSQPQYGFENKQVLVSEASTRMELVPAVYDFKEEQVLVREAAKRLVQVPAVWETKTEQVLEHAAYTVWKRGGGPVQKINNSTGEIMCLVEVPAKYKTVSTRVLKTPATTTEEEVPAEYKTVRRRVMATPPTTRSVEVPARYATVKVRTITKPEEVRTAHVPEEYQTVTKSIKTSDGHMEWRPVLCGTNMNNQVIAEIQTKLHQGGYYHGPVDGVMGKGTLAGVGSFQQAKGLPRGGLTIETLEQLGLRMD